LLIDLQFTEDGYIVLQHDATLDRWTTGTGLVADRTLKEQKQLRLKPNNTKVPSSS
jgi:glycerophosphoryl diester phosphodiesterase